MANRIALLKQEEMKTWKKIEETKKRTNDITGLKKRNEEKVQKVNTFYQYSCHQLRHHCSISYVISIELILFFKLDLSLT